MRFRRLLPVAMIASVGCTSPGEVVDPPDAVELSACGDTTAGTLVLTELGLSGYARMVGDRLVMIGDDRRLSRLDPCTGHGVPLSSTDAGGTAAIAGGFVYTPSGDSLWRVPLDPGNTTFVALSPQDSHVMQGADQALLVEIKSPGGLARVTRLDDNQVLFERGDQLEGKLVKLQTQGTNGLYLSVQDQAPPPLPDTPVERVPWTILRVPVGAFEPVAVPGAEVVFSADAFGDELFVARAAGSKWEIARIDSTGAAVVVVPASSDLEDLTEVTGSEDLVCWRSADEAILCRRLHEGSQTIRISGPTDRPGYGIFIHGDVFWSRLRPNDIPRSDLLRTVLAE